MEKNRYNFTINKETMQEFRKYCKENCISMSAKVESMIKNFLKEKLE